MEECDVARVSWIYSHVPYYSSSEVQRILNNNPVEFGLLDNQPEFQELKLNNLKTKIIFRKKSGDPRLVLQHKFQLTYSRMNRRDFAILDNFLRFQRQTVYLKLYQFDAGHSTSPVVADAVECEPKGDGTYEEYFCPYCNLSDDSEDAVKTRVWVDEVLQPNDGSVYTIAHTTGVVTFATPLLSTNRVRMTYVWKPKVRVLSIDPKPTPGLAYGKSGYTPVVVMREL